MPGRGCGQAGDAMLNGRGMRQRATSTEAILPAETDGGEGGVAPWGVAVASVSLASSS
ncbi:MAG: hypothetical protein H6Q86_2231 [candidate division NC10 bacterium]|nr:hypothetical protein [candidate division NC10 bacterium]